MEYQRFCRAMGVSPQFELDDGSLIGEDTEYVQGRGQDLADRLARQGLDDADILARIEQDYILFCNPRAY